MWDGDSLGKEHAGVGGNRDRDGVVVVRGGGDRDGVGTWRGEDSGGTGEDGGQ